MRRRWTFSCPGFFNQVASMKLTPFERQLLPSPQSRMAIKLTTLVILLTLCYTMLSTSLHAQKVLMPEGCARACPPQRDPARFICARNTESGRLGMFDSECFFGRYNHCNQVRTRELQIQLIEA